MVVEAAGQFCLTGESEQVPGMAVGWGRGPWEVRGGGRVGVV